MYEPCGVRTDSRRTAGAGLCKLRSIGIASYRSEHELTFYLRALQKIRSGRLVVVLGLCAGQRLPTDLPSGLPIIPTVDANDMEPEEVVGGYVPDPLQAVSVAMASLPADDGLILLFPVDWQGESPDSLIEKAHHRLILARTYSHSHHG